jgi:O-antigen/teichoic acid export membrane protein
VTTPAYDPHTWGPHDRYLELVARNVSTRYAAIAVEGVIGLMLLPFNVSHLGQAAYGLWALTSSFALDFSVLDLGYAGALVKFIAQYRAWRDRQALNEVLSTMFVLLAGVGLVSFLVSGVIAWQFGRVFKVRPDQVGTARDVMLIVGAYIAIRFPASVFGSVVYGFQRYYLNNIISIISTVVVALVNVFVLARGGDLVMLVLATTAVRVLTLGCSAQVAFRVYPGLQIHPRLYRRERIREVAGFSVYVLILDWSAKLNYSTDALVIGALLSTSAVAVWAVGQRLAEVSQRLTIQFSTSLFPMIVASDAGQRPDRLRLLLVQGTRVSLALAVPVCFGLGVMADRVIGAWVGPNFGGSVIVTQLLLAVVLVRVGLGSATALLKGGGGHALLAWTNGITAIVNIVLSVLLIKPFGLVGVAVGTLAPVTISAVFVLFPAACRRIGMRTLDVARQAVFPAVWPVIASLVIVWIGHPFVTTLPTIAALLLGSGLAYELLFFGVALDSAERRFYWIKLTELIGRRWRVATAA